MIKNGRVEVGKTPSEVSGRKSQTLKEGSAVCNSEEAPEVKIEDLKIPEDK